MASLRRIPLSVKLPGLTVAAVLLAAGLSTLLALFLGRQAARAAVRDERNREVQTYATAVRFYVEAARALLETTGDAHPLGDDLAAASAGPQGAGPGPGLDVLAREWASRLLARSRVFDHVMLLGADGRVLILEPADLQARLLRPDLAFAPWYQEVVRTGREVVSDLQISVATRQPAVMVAMPVRAAGGRVLGVWAGGLRLQELSRIGAAGERGQAPARESYLTDRRGLILAHQARSKHVREQTDFSSLPPVRAALAGGRGIVQYTSPLEGGSGWRPIRSWRTRGGSPYPSWPRRRPSPPSSG